MLLGVGLSNPITLGCLMGCLYTVAPDHIGTLMALTAGVSSLSRAFMLGCCWGVGHSLSMVLVFIVCVGLHFTVNTQAWENIGNYFAGVIMICVGLYFLMFEASYLERKEDGSFAATPCSCSSHARDDDGSLESHGALADEHGPIAGVCAETAPLLWKQDSSVPSYGREVRGFILGIMQGMCCPSCLLGISFASRITTDTYGAAVVGAFITAFVLASALGTGAFAVAWTMLTTQGARSFLSPRLVYRGSCGVTIVVGICWIVANFAGVMRFLDFADHALEQ